MKKAIFAFNGDPMCFIHVLLNTLDMHDNGVDVKLVIEGSATKLIKEMNEEGHMFYKNFNRIKELNIVSVCKACANKMGTLEEAKKQNIPLEDDMFGHPSMRKYIENGYDIISM